MSIFGVGPERYNVSAGMFGYGLDENQDQACQKNDMQSAIEVAYMANSAQSEIVQAIAQQAVEPERQPDIVQSVEVKEQPAKRKYTKRAK